MKEFIATLSYFLLVVPLPYVAGHRSKKSKEPAFSFINSGVKKELIRATGITISRTKSNVPNAGNADYLIVWIPQLILEATGDSVKSKDLPAAELANQDAMAETSKISWGNNEAPRSIKPGTTFQALQQDAGRR